MRRSLFTAASFVGQGVISQFDPKLVPDGKWGRFTQSRYVALSNEQRFAVDNALKAMGTNATQLMEFREQERLVGMFSVQSNDARATVLKAAAESGIDPEVAIAYAKIESNLGKNTGGEQRKRIFPDGYHGLMQMGADAWADARKQDPSLPAFSIESAYDDYTNARAAFAFSKNNVRVARRYGWDGEVNATALYLMHQQGAGGFVWLWSLATGRPNKLKPGYRIPAKNLAGNPPQDKKGATSDPVQFFARWDGVIREKMAEA